LALFRSKGKGIGKTLRWSLIKAILRKGKGLNTEKIEDYGKENKVLLKSVLKTARRFKGNDVCYLIDSSKDLYRLFYLQQSELFDIRVIHLYKSPKGYVYSNIKRRSGLERFLKMVRFSTRWIVENLLIERVVSFFPPEKVIKIHYQDMASRPERILQLLSDKFGISFDSSLKDTFREKKHHVVSGNNSKYRKEGIELDEKWKKGLSVFEKVIIGILTAGWAWKHSFVPKKNV